MIHQLLKSADRIFNSTEPSPVDRWKNEAEHFSTVEFKDGEKAKDISGLTDLISFYRTKEKKAKLCLKEKYASGQKHTAPALIIAGSGKNSKDDHIIESELKTILRGFKGTVISGGTNTGIPGMTGRIAAELRSEGCHSFELTGYTPQKIPSGNKISSGYDRIIRSPGSGFSFTEVLCYWTDLIFSDIDRKDIYLIGIKGGKIALLEYKMALTMGIPVFLIQSREGAAGKILKDSYWSAHQNLHFLPDDAQELSIWMHTNGDKPMLLNQIQ